MTNLLIVESPAKAKTIGKYLGKGYEIMASYGHIRDLPSKPGSVDVDQNFDMKYQVNSKSKKHVDSIIKKAGICDTIMLAPDPDREGESIAWHILEILKQKGVIKGKKIQRVVFNAITKKSVLEAIDNPRDINMDLVDAQQSRRALDYLVGFNLSPILWRKLPGSKSAGRVQSVALRMICEREEEIELFKSEEYWDIKVNLKNNSNETATSTVTHVNDKKLEKFSIPNEQTATEISRNLEDKSYTVKEIKEREVKRKPYPPFMTSTLQQEAARKLGFSTKKTMQLAQKLYEGLDIGGNVQGLITYMRTDGIYVDPEAINSARKYINTKYGAKYLPQKPIIYKSKVKNAQEAHEAIRPTDPLLSPGEIKQYLDKDHFRLYDLIWKRMISSQMSDVITKQVSIDVITNPKYAQLRITGSVIKFDGFYILYNETKDESEVESKSNNIPNLQQNEDLSLVEIIPNQHFTEPPPRYSEASLVKRMEELSIGRPSTYASIISVLQDRGYVKLEKKRFIPEQRGRVVTTFLKEFFSNYIQYDYTAKLEDDLDKISNGKIQWKDFLKNFWLPFSSNTKEISKKTISEVLDKLNEKLSPSIFGFDEKGELKNKCESCDTGLLGVKLGKFGVFVGCSNYPECKNTKQLSNEGDNISLEDNKSSNYDDPKSLGKHSQTNEEILLKKGPYGFYIELQNSVEKKGKKTKPKRVSIPKNISLENVSLELSEKLLSLPRSVGIHPETGLEIKASIGPFGPYLLHNKIYSSVKEDDILEVGLNRAVTIIADYLESKESKLNKKNNTSKKSKKKT